MATRRYERSREAREACIAARGVECVVCGFDLEKMYGPLGRRYIHVHHVVHLLLRNGAHVVNPYEDLRPVCANCHVMLHRSQAAEDLSRIITPEELAQSLAR